ncbi:hypothetical protein ACTD5D_26435 [Nocardia takedensis]|uniref:hypothetical protein n=1 Tax=Nocardia takedensis TaxID=259390 RepID=UPI000318B9B7|nr:hypothetical protein [Nocardia takedensis]
MRVEIGDSEHISVARIGRFTALGRDHSSHGAAAPKRDIAMIGPYAGAAQRDSAHPLPHNDCAMTRPRFGRFP